MAIIKTYNSLDHLTDDTREAAKRLLSVLEGKGLNPIVISTYRSPEHQVEIYNRSKKEAIPETISPHSWHSAGRALDIQISPMTSAGGTDMDNVSFFIITAQQLGFNTTVDAQGKSLEPAAAHLPQWWDWHHVSFRGGRTLAQALTEYASLALGPDTRAPGIAHMMAATLTMYGLYKAGYNAL